VAESAGSKSQVTGLVGAGVVTVLLVLLPGLLRDLPQTALAAVVISAAISLASVKSLRSYARVRRSALVLSLTATIGVVLLGVLEGILLAVVLSVFMFFRRNWWPRGVVLGKVPDMEGWHSLERFPDAEQQPGVVVFRWGAPLFFANSGIFRQAVHRLVRRERPRWVVLQCEAVTDIDVTAAGMLERLDLELNAQGVHLAFVELRHRLQDLVYEYGLHETIDRDRFYDSVEQALADLPMDLEEIDPDREPS
jgi:MFS superfamily sulfate permease-like transporter